MIGIFSKTIDSNLVEAGALAGLDFMIFDQEHGPADLSVIHNHVRAIKVAGKVSVIRVRENTLGSISSALDTGVDMIQVPNINSVEDAQRAINASKFYPKGSRGVCCYVKSANYGNTEKQEYFHLANKKKLVLQVEGVEGIRNLDAILNLDGFDILFIGPYDLSQSIGKPGEIRSKEVLNEIKKIRNKVVKSGKELGTFVDDERLIVDFKNQGFSYIAFSVDLSLFSKACKIIRNIYDGGVFK
jgi:4-hydroxy-2-oxoheptanedioate aldolase